MAEVAAARLHPADTAEGPVALLRTFAAVQAVLGLLQLLAEIGLSETAEGRARRGPRPDAFRKALFANLAGFHYRMFGCAPEFERNRGERDSSGVEWARAILRLAVHRVPDVLLLPSADPTCRGSSH
jgi:hypothetical protein